MNTPTGISPELAAQVDALPPAELQALIVYAKAHQRAVEKAEHAKACDAAWARVRFWKPGTKLWVCASGTFLGGPFQRGDAMKVYAVQPKKKLLWVEAKGKKHWFAPNGILRYDLRPEPPAAPLSKLERSFAESTAAVFNRLK